MINKMNQLVLILYSHRFGKKNSFRKKIKELLSSTNNYSLIVLDDNRKFMSTEVDDHLLVSCKAVKYKTNEIIEILNNVDKVIAFWDGTDITEFIYRAISLKKDLRIVPVDTTKVVNIESFNKFDVYIGRKTPWGNPFQIGVNGDDRMEVIKKFKERLHEQLKTNPNRKKELLTLQGKVLGCHCKPSPCHGDVIAEYLNTLED